MRIDPSKRFLLACTAAALCGLVSTKSFSQSFFTPSDSLNPPRLVLVAGGWAAIYSGALVGLNSAWYNQHERTSFHAFNDWPEWKQMDKAGHVWTAYNEARWTAQALKWSGVKAGVADIAGVGTALLFQTTLEMFDAYSAKWGFSWSDMGANVAGAGLFFSQEKIWHEQRVVIKFSAHDVRYKRLHGAAFTHKEAQRVMGLYGQSFAEKILKDYNGQTYWLSVNPSSFTQSFKPRWLNIAVGYGADGIFGGTENVWRNENGLVEQTNIERTRQFYLSPDIDFTRIPTNSPLLKTLFEMANVFKLPAPALMLDTKGRIKFHPLYF